MSPLREEAALSVASYLDGRLRDRIFIHHQTRLVRILLHEIKYVEAHRAYCRLVTTGGRYTLSIPLAALARQLPDNRLWRAHRSYLVNLHWVEEVADRCLIIDGTSIPIARAQYEELGDHLQLIR